MVRPSRKDGTLQAKIVYYGPAGGGKTCNLEALHRMTDPRRGHELLTVSTRKDSTLFFDLLRFDLEDVLGRRVGVKIYSVPGQVRYDATRKVVLGGADVVVFVADSSAARREQNIWSLQNLRMNMRAKDLDPERVPILFQMNKRDVPDAAHPDELAESLGVPASRVIPAVSTRGEGVLETFRAACHAALRRQLERVPEDDLARALDRAFAPYADRVKLGWPDKRPEPPPRTPIVLTDDDLLEGAIATSVLLGEGRSAEAALSRRLAREADGFRRLGELLCEIGSGADRARVVEGVLGVARDVLEAASVTLVREAAAGPLIVEARVGSSEDPLSSFASGRDLLRRLVSGDHTGVIEDLAQQCDAKQGRRVVDRYRSVAAVQVAQEESTALVAYGARSAGPFEEADVEFLRFVARHLAAALEKSKTHEDLDLHRDQLDRTVARSGPPRRALDRVRERFLTSLSHEMRAPLAAVARAATGIRDLDAPRAEREQLAKAISGSADLLQRQLRELERLIHVGDTEPLRLAPASPRRVIEEAIRMSGHKKIRRKIEHLAGRGRFDRHGLARAIANLIDNAVKFSPSGSPVTVRLTGSRIGTDAGEIDAMTVSLLDRGPGVSEKERKRIFAPFTHGGPADKRTPQGMGIGLYEARCVAERHGGSLEYAARKGGGSEFRLTIPLQPIAKEALMEVNGG